MSILKRYDVSAETYRQRIRTETRKPNESYIKATSKPVMVAMQGLSKQLKLQDGKLNGKDVQVLLDTGSETSIARASLVDPTKCTQQTVKVQYVQGDVIAYPSALVDLKIDG